MTFLVDNVRYLAPSDDVVVKAFADVAVKASNILRHKIPEVKGGANVYANLVADAGVIAEYKDGKVNLVK
jgi:hypothetical protein